MLAEPSTIFFSTQLRFLPIDELQFGKGFVRELYSALSEPGQYAYENLNLQNSPPFMSTNRTSPAGEGISICRIRPDRIEIEETDPDIHLESFLEVIDTVLKAAAEIKETTAPVFAQRCLFRCLVKPKSANSISLLAGKVSNVFMAMHPFERPPMHFGIRFRFPPYETETKGEDGAVIESEKRHNFASVRIETWAKDVSLVWIEVDATYFFQETLTLEDRETVSKNIKETHQFLTEKCLRFLEQFDDRPEPENNDDPEEEKG